MMIIIKCNDVYFLAHLSKYYNSNLSQLHGYEIIITIFRIIDGWKELNIYLRIIWLYNILGFLRPGLQPSVISNFGLLDQVAAIHWLRENVKQFRGDPNSITLVGHGTGAAMVSLLLTSPVAQASEGIKIQFWILLLLYI